MSVGVFIVAVMIYLTVLTIIATVGVYYLYKFAKEMKQIVESTWVK